MSGAPAMEVDAGTGLAPQRLIVSRHGQVGVIALASHEGERVRLTPERLESLLEAIRRLGGCDDVALLMLLGGVREFCLGADLARLRTASAAEAERYLRVG